MQKSQSTKFLTFTIAERVTTSGQVTFRQQGRELSADEYYAKFNAGINTGFIALQSHIQFSDEAATVTTFVTPFSVE